MPTNLCRTKLASTIHTVRCIAAVSVIAFVVAGAPGFAGAQETIYIGGQSRPAVEVDLGALDDVGRSPVRQHVDRPALRYPDVSGTRRSRPVLVSPQRRPMAAPEATTIISGDRGITPMAKPRMTPGSLVGQSPPASSPPALIPAQPPAPISGLGQAEARAPARLAPTPPVQASKNGLQPAPPPPPVAPLMPPPGAKPPAIPQPPVVQAPPSAAPVPLSPSTTAPPPTAVQPRPATRVAPPPPPTPSRPPAAAPTVAAAQPADAFVPFEAGSAILSPEALAQLNRLASEIRDDKRRLQLKAHATTADNGASARRLSLKRALASRAHLIDQGIDSTRIDVRALGPANDGGPADRVDIILLGP